MADIVLKDRNGSEITYPNVNTIRVKKTDGNTHDFVDSDDLPEALENIPIPVDFSGGNQTITAPDGTLVKSAIILKPEKLVPENIKIGETVGGITGEFIGNGEEVVRALNMIDGDQVVEPVMDGMLLSKITIQKPNSLVPENIVNGVDIGGIIGTFAGGANVKFAQGTFLGNNSTVTVNHNFGVNPDIVLVWKSQRTLLTDKQYLDNGVMLSQEFKTKYGTTKRGFYTVSKKNSSNNNLNQMDTTTSSMILIIGSYTTSSITFATTTYPTETNVEYYWFAIGGLV